MWRHGEGWYLVDVDGWREVVIYYRGEGNRSRIIYVAFSDQGGDKNQDGV